MFEGIIITWSKSWIEELSGIEHNLGFVTPKGIYMFDVVLNSI